MATSRITGTNEVVTEYHHDGGYDYDDLDDWEAATDLDLVNTEHNSPVLECHAGYHDAGSAVTLDGATCDATYFRIIRPVSADMHSGIPKTDGTIVCFAPDIANGRAFYGDETYSSFQDLCIIWAADDGAACFGVWLHQNLASAIGCMVKVTNAGAGGGYGMGNSTNTTPNFINCLIFECKSDNVRNEAAANLYNCTSIDAGDDNFDDTGGNATYKNCLANGAGDDDYETPGATTTCGDGDGTGDLTVAPSFVDAANNDYHLAPGSDGIGDGTDVSGDGYGDDDIDFQARGAVWDMGFDEFVGGFVNIGDVWKPIETLQVNIGDVWKDVAEVHLNVGDVWKRII